MITDYTDAVGTPILPGARVVVACHEGFSSKRIAMRVGKVYRVSLNSIGVEVENAGKFSSPMRSYTNPKRFIVIK